MNNDNLELQAIQDSNKCKTARGECWKQNLANQFPVKEISSKKGELEVLVGAPHDRYTIQTTLLNYKLNGESHIISDEKVIVADLYFDNGIASGPCTLFDKSGLLFFRGRFENGYRHGKGTEYDENGNVIFEGIYDNGIKKPIIRMKEKKGYWKEYDEKGNLVNISQRDEYGRMKGICYLYNSEGEISRVSEWKEGREICLCKQFTNDYMTELKRGLNHYIGEYKKSFQSDYAYEGEGKLYDNDGKSAIYKGHFCNGKRHGLGISYRKGKISYNGKWIMGMPSCVFITTYIMLILILTIAFVLNVFIAMVLLGILIIFIVLKRIFAKQTGNWLNSIDYACLGEIIYTTHKKRGEKEGGCLTLAHHLYSIALTFFVILFCIAAVYHFCFMPCNGYILQWYYYAGQNQCNSVNSFNPNMKSQLRSIRIGDDCFSRVKTFKIDELNRLKTIKIGYNSFTQEKNSNGNDKSKSFHILNCESLESIQIKQFSFSDFAGDFELKNLPQLQSIQIGTIGSWSSNFCCSSFVIRGIDMILNI